MNELEERIYNKACYNLIDNIEANIVTYEEFIETEFLNDVEYAKYETFKSLINYFNSELETLKNDYLN